MNFEKRDFVHDTSRILERRLRGVKYVVIGKSPYGFTELSAESEADAKSLGSIWKQVYASDAECFCVQNGEIGGRPFFSFLVEN